MTGTCLIIFLHIYIDNSISNKKNLTLMHSKQFSISQVVISPECFGTISKDRMTGTCLTILFTYLHR